MQCLQCFQFKFIAFISICYYFYFQFEKAIIFQVNYYSQHRKLQTHTEANKQAHICQIPIGIFCIHTLSLKFNIRIGRLAKLINIWRFHLMCIETSAQHSMQIKNGNFKLGKFFMSWQIPFVQLLIISLDIVQFVYLRGNRMISCEWLTETAQKEYESFVWF